MERNIQQLIKLNICGKFIVKGERKVDPFQDAAEFKLPEFLIRKHSWYSYNLKIVFFCGFYKNPFEIFYNN